MSFRVKRWSGLITIARLNGCGLAGRPQMPYPALEPVADLNPVLAGLIAGESGPRLPLPEGGLKPVDVLINQGFRGTLFDFNDAWWRFLCYNDLAAGQPVCVVMYAWWVRCRCALRLRRYCVFGAGQARGWRLADY